MNPIFLTHNDELIQTVVSFINEWENDLDFFITQTSGSTGNPKEVKVLKKHAIQSCHNTEEALNIQKGDKALLCLNPETIGGKMMIIRAIVLNLELYVTDAKANPIQFNNHCFDFIAIVPLQLQAIITECPDKIKNIKNVIVGGSVISSELESALIKQNITVFQTFGMTETISHIALKKVGEQGSEYYTVLPNIAISTSQDQLIIDAPTLGVSNLLTTDRIELININQFKWLGRSDFVINSGGIKIHPEQVEQILSEKISEPFFVTGINDEKFGQKLIVAIQSQPNSYYSKKSIYSSLPPFHIPKEVWFFDTFEWTKSNKINRKQTLTNFNAREVQQIS